MKSCVRPASCQVHFLPVYSLAGQCWGSHLLMNDIGCDPCTLPGFGWCDSPGPGLWEVAGVICFAGRGWMPSAELLALWMSSRKGCPWDMCPSNLDCRRSELSSLLPSFVSFCAISYMYVNYRTSRIKGIWVKRERKKKKANNLFWCKCHFLWPWFSWQCWGGRKEVAV